MAHGRRGRVIVTALASTGLALACAGGERQVNQLRAEQAATRAAAARELGQLRFAPAREALAEALADTEAEVRREAAAALAAIADPAAAGALLEGCGSEVDGPTRQAMEAALDSLGAPATEQALAGLASASFGLRIAAAGHLGRVGEPRAFEPLLAAALDANEPYRSPLSEAAAAALRTVGAAAAGRAALAAFGEREPPARRAHAAALLGVLGDPAAAPALAALLFEKPSRAELGAWKSNGIEEDEEELEPVEGEDDAEEPLAGDDAPAPGRPEPEGTPRCAAAEALAALGAAGLDALLGAARNESPPIRTCAVSGLALVRDRRALDALLALLPLDPIDEPTGTLDFALIQALGNQGREAELALVAAARHGGEIVRERALRALTVRPQEVSPAVVDVLLAALEDEDWSVRSTAGFYLSNRREARVVERLLAEYEERDLDSLVAAYPYYVERAIPGSERALLDALRASEVVPITMADALLNSGNQLLERGVREWCESQPGCKIEKRDPDALSAVPSWGAATAGN